MPYDGGETEKQEMRACDAGLEAMLAHGGGWVWETDASLTISALSAAYATITGFPREEIIGKRRLDFPAAPNLTPETFAHLADLQARRDFTNVLRELHGGPPHCRWLAVSGKARFDESGAFVGFRGIAQNITPLVGGLLRRNAWRGETGCEPEQSLSQTELLHQVLDEMPVAAALKSQHLTYEYVNKAWSAMTGIRQEEAVGALDTALFPRDVAGVYMRDAAEVMSTGKVLEVEEPVAHRDGTLRQVMTRVSRVEHSDGSFHLVETSTDISEVNARQAELTETLSQNELFRNLIDNVPVAIYAKQSDLRLVYVNKGWCEMADCAREDAIGRSDIEIFGYEGGRDYQASDLAALQSKEPLQFDEVAESEDGDTRHRLARKNTMAAADGSLYLIGSTTDVTEMKKRERELSEARSRAVLADRAKSEFLANMSHEIRTPMNGVLGMAELLARSDLDAKQRTFVDIIVKSGNALLTIINDILDFSKIDAGRLMLDPVRFDLAEAVEDVATLISARAREKDLELAVRIAPQASGTYRGDVGRIRQVVTNLVGNAVKFTERGHVLIDVSAEGEGEGSTVTITVSDSGIGIPKSKLGHVFETFSQVDASSTRRHEGTGLGLAITARLVALMQGRIDLQSEEGRGSVFRVTLPLPRETAAAPEAVPASEGVTARVLVIDDNAVSRAVLCEQLGWLGLDVCGAASGAEGLAVLDAVDQLGLAVDCVVLDQAMPDLSGAEVARRIRARLRTARTPIVMLTSAEQALGGVSVSDLDAQLIKPVRAAALGEAVTQAIRTRRADAGRAVLRPAPALVPASRHLTPKRVSGGGRLDILVAEDNEVNQLVFTQILMSTPFSFEIVTNGRLACEAFHTSRPRLVLMDVSMPEMNGIEATEEIRRAEAESGDHTPVIGVSAHALKGDRDRCLGAGMDDHLAKPISPKTLLEKIALWLPADEEPLLAQA
ncbi:MAG: hypothetical protein DI629_09800 [Mesorhizobium amorphae]|nr:MAG: hypothetical protein DI629_09800 [Mesorhizobium amorphae]